MLRRSLLALSIVLPALPALPALAQEAWPSRPITLMAGFPNGSGVDIYQRKLAEPLSRALGVPVVVDNRTGAGGNIGSDFVAKARPDGYTILLATAGTHAINATLYRRLPFDPLNDVSHIAMLGDVPNLLTTSIDHRPNFNSCADVLAAARARPGALNYASTGNGASTHLAGVQFAQAAGIDVVHVPYRGQPGAQLALLSGDVDFFFNQVGPALGAVQQGKTRGLAVTTPTRLSILPDVPTVAEACDLPGFSSTTWYGIVGPPGMPAPIVARLNAEILKILDAPEFQGWLVQSQGISPPTARTPEEFRAVHERDIASWRTVIQRSGATVD